MYDTVAMGGVVLALTEAVKRTLGLNGRYVPITSLVLSFVLFFIAGHLQDVSVSWETVMSAITVGLMSGGIWSGVKSTAGL